MICPLSYCHLALKQYEERFKGLIQEALAAQGENFSVASFDTYQADTLGVVGCFWGTDGTRHWFAIRSQGLQYGDCAADCKLMAYYKIPNLV